MRVQGGALMAPGRVCGRLNSCSVARSPAPTPRVNTRSCLAAVGAICAGRRSGFSTLVVVFVGLQNTVLDVALPLTDQRGAEGSALRWVERVEAIATWSWTATVQIGLVGSDLLTLIPASMPSTSPSAALSILRSW